MKLKKEDPVIVIAGNDKGKEGKVVSISGDRIVVKGVNRKKKHQKPREENKKGAIVEFDAPVHISNVMYSAGGEPVKLRVRENADGKKEIYYRTKNNEENVIRTVR